MPFAQLRIVLKARTSVALKQQNRKLNNVEVEKMRRRLSDKLTMVFRRAEELRRSPESPAAKRFSEYPIAPRDVVLSRAPVPANTWFVDVGGPHDSYGPFKVVRIQGLHKVLPGKLAPALCPQCGNPIFTILLCEEGKDAPVAVRQQCVVCGFSADITPNRR